MKQGNKNRNITTQTCTKKGKRRPVHLRFGAFAPTDSSGLNVLPVALLNVPGVAVASAGHFGQRLIDIFSQFKMDILSA